jgi:hypothetical protein
VWTLTRHMPEQYEHHGLSGEYVMLPSGEMVPDAEYQPPKAAEPVKPAQPSKAKD